MEANAPYITAAVSENHGNRSDCLCLQISGRPHSIEQEPDILEFRTCRDIFQSDPSVHDDASQNPVHTTSAIRPPLADRDHD